MKKGISIVSIGIVLIILTIITGIVIVSSEDYIEEAKKAKFVAEYMLVESAVNKYYDNNQSYPVKLEDGSEVTTSLSISPSADKTQFSTSVSSVSLKVIDLSLLGYDDLTIGLGADSKDYYGVSSTGDVYYIKGIKYKDKLYYKMADNLT